MCRLCLVSVLYRHVIWMYGCMMFIISIIAKTRLIVVRIMECKNERRESCNIHNQCWYVNGVWSNNSTGSMASKLRENAEALDKGNSCGLTWWLELLGHHPIELLTNQRVFIIIWLNTRPTREQIMSTWQLLESRCLHLDIWRKGWGHRALSGMKGKLFLWQSLRWWLILSNNVSGFF